MKFGVLMLVTALWGGVVTPLWAGPRPDPGAYPQARDPRAAPEPFQQAKPPYAAQPVVVPRGQLLYENHCTACHESAAHVRDARRADSLPVLRGWVVQWARYLELRWREDEIGEVVRYLNDRYYRFEARP